MLTISSGLCVECGVFFDEHADPPFGCNCEFVCEWCGLVNSHNPALCYDCHHCFSASTNCPDGFHEEFLPLLWSLEPAERGLFLHGFREMLRSVDISAWSARVPFGRLEESP